MAIGTVVFCEVLNNLDQREFTIQGSGGSKDDKDDAVRVKVAAKHQPFSMLVRRWRNG
jgi:hypothetical protein